jgi:branched-chain amino acid transport system permease protein
MVSLLGINVFQIFSLVFCTGAATAALAVFSRHNPSGKPFMGIGLWELLVVVVVGGMGSFQRGLVGRFVDRHRTKRRGTLAAA